VKPYAGNDLSLGALRSSSWIRTLAVWREVPRLQIEVAAGPVVQWVADRATEDLIVAVRREMAHPLAGHVVSVVDSHADFFTAGRVVVLAEVRALVLRHPPIFPPLVLFPRVARLHAWWRRLVAHR
jgi:hypothetical protein